MDFIKFEWIKPLYKILVDRHNTRTDIISEIANIFGDPTTLAKYYVEPNLQHLNPADMDEDQLGARSELRVPAFHAFNEFLKGDIVEKHGRNQMFIQADAGMGKTSLLLMIRLMQLLKFWPGGFYCEIEKIGSETVDRINAIEKKHRTILLLDALDEDVDSISENIENRVVELLAASSMFYRVLISCRTQYFPEVSDGPFRDPGRIQLGGYVCPVWFLSPFSDQQVDEFIKKKYPIPNVKKPAYFLHLRFPKITPLFKILKNELNARTDAKGLVGRMHSLQFRPFLISHIDDLKNLESHVYLDETSIYRALVDVWLTREVAKLSKMKNFESIKVADLKRSCIYLAWHMFTDNVLAVDEKTIVAIATKSKNLTYLTKFDFGGRSLLNRNSERCYRFAHKSIMEYLVAEHFVEYSSENEFLELSRCSVVTKKFVYQLAIDNSQASNTGTAVDANLIFVLLKTDMLGSENMHKCLEDISAQMDTEYGVATRAAKSKRKYWPKNLMPIECRTAIDIEVGLGSELLVICIGQFIRESDRLNWIFCTRPSIDKKNKYFGLLYMGNKSNMGHNNFVGVLMNKKNIRKFVHELAISKSEREELLDNIRSIVNGGANPRNRIFKTS